MKFKEIFEKACGEIAKNFPDFKATRKGRHLKKKSKNKNIIFEIYFETSSRNYSGSIAIIPYISICYGKERTLIFHISLGYINARQEYQSWNLAGLNFQPVVQTLTEQLKSLVIPIFELFENIEQTIDFLLENGTKFNSYIKRQEITPFYFIFDYGGKDKAEIFLNNFVKNCSYKGKFYHSYKILKSLLKENIDMKISSFIGEDVLKFAVLNDIYLNV